MSDQSRTDGAGLLSAVAPDGRRVLPVILGGDLGIYAIARAFHEAYGIDSVIMSGVATGAVRNSKFAANVVVPGMDEAAILVPALLELASGYPDRLLIVIANADWLVRALVENREVLQAKYLVPYLDIDLLDRVSDKASFYQICSELEIDIPFTVVVDLGVVDPSQIAGLDIPIEYPLIAKASSSSAYHFVEFEGKKKVFALETRGELDVLLHDLHAAGYRDSFVVQEMIPGDDAQMRSITAYRDARGVITCLSAAHVLLEEHTPGALGNPAAMITGAMPEVWDQAARLLNSLDYVGWANFDVKVDPRDGSYRFFEVNPRIGRNNYYVTAAGANTAFYLMEDQVFDRTPEPVRSEASILYSVVPLRLLKSYLADAKLLAKIDELKTAGLVFNPLDYAADRNVRRVFYVWTALLNQIRKFRTYYPKR